MSFTGFENVRDDLEGLDEASLRSLVERAARVQELAAHPAWTLLTDYLAALTSSAQKRVLFGYCQTIEEYRYETGRIAGLREAMEAPERLLQQVRNRQEQAEQAAWTPE